MFKLFLKFRKEAERLIALEEEKVRNYQRLLDEAREYSLRKAILEDSVKYFESNLIFKNLA